MPKTIFSVGQERLQKLLREAREAEGLTQSDVAKRLKKPQSYVIKYETGESRLYLIELREVCQALGTSLVRFIERFERSVSD